MYWRGMRRGFFILASELPCTRCTPHPLLYPVYSVSPCGTATPIVGHERDLDGTEERSAGAASAVNVQLLYAARHGEESREGRSEEGPVGRGDSHPEDIRSERLRPGSAASERWVCGGDDAAAERSHLLLPVVCRRAGLKRGNTALGRDTVGREKRERDLHSLRDTLSVALSPCSQPWSSSSVSLARTSLSRNCIHREIHAHASALLSPETSLTDRRFKN